MSESRLIQIFLALSFLGGTWATFMFAMPTSNWAATAFFWVLGSILCMFPAAFIVAIVGILAEGIKVIPWSGDDSRSRAEERANWRQKGNTAYQQRLKEMAGR